MPIFVYGISHKTADLCTREYLSFPLETIPQVLFDLRSAVPAVKEIMMLSTCQRTECYLYTDEPFLDLSQLGGKTLSKFSDWKKHAYTLSGEDALTHVMKVANGLDSSLLGEPQILGQIKSAYGSAKAFGFLGKHLEQVMQFIFATAKKVRHQTSIGQGAVSLPYAAVSLGKCIFSEIPNPYVLLIGAGSVIQNILNHLVKKKNLTVVITNRSFEKAAKLADKYGIKAIRLSDIYEHVALADIVISATSSTSLILQFEDVKQALAARQKKQPVFMMDMAVPRDIAPAVADLETVFLYNIDDLHKVIQNHLDARLQAASGAENIIKTQVQVLMHRMQMNQLSPTIHNFRNQFELFRQQLLKSALFQLEEVSCAETVISQVLSELEKWALNVFDVIIEKNRLREEALLKAFHQLNLGKAPAQVLSQVTRSFVNQLLHKPTLHLKSIGKAPLPEVSAISEFDF